VVGDTKLPRLNNQGIVVVAPCVTEGMRAITAKIIESIFFIFLTLIMAPFLKSFRNGSEVWEWGWVWVVSELNELFSVTEEE